MRGLTGRELLLAISFFVSGVAALLYQLCWNRALYGAVGVDMDSVAIIVSCFMLGIGIGAGLGGWLADRWPRAKVWFYALTELGLCLFGLLSLALIDGAAGLVGSPGALGLALTSGLVFLVLLFPTVLMGMTLPLLSLAFQEVLGNMGAAVGRLYFANTLGGASGAFLASQHLFMFMDLRQTTWLAAALNAGVALVTLAALYAHRALVAKGGWQ